MNVIFLDFEGVLITDHYELDKDLEKRIQVLADICQEYDCKIVIEASAKDAIDESSKKVHGCWVPMILELFKKYGIECIGRTPNVIRRIDDYSELSMWKEDEIRLYLMRHPEIEHYCVIDDDDTINTYHWERSDLEKVRDHLVTPLYYSDNPEEEGLLFKHKKQVGEILKKENEVKTWVLKWRKSKI